MPSDTPATLRLDNDLTIIHVADLRTRLLAWLAGRADHAGDNAGVDRLDLSGVASIDTAGVQLLLALRRSLQATGRALVLHAPAPAITEVLTRYGLADALLAPASASMTGGRHGD